MANKLSRKRALELYRNTINYNVILRYDPAVKKLLYHTSYCVIYKYDDSHETWNKTDYHGSVSLYLRTFEVPAGASDSLQDLQKLFCYGLILLNKSSPQCFLLGLLPNNVIRHYFPRGVGGHGVGKMEVELNDNLIIVKTLEAEIFGLWVFDENDRAKLYKLLCFCLSNEM